jgi:3-hydroxyisobutyrate dehydrogenase-like beta-hydroxyacid dehydrogenase
MAADIIGLVGVGKMGSALLVQLRAAGHQVRAFDIFPAAMTAAEKAGALPAASPADAARDCAFVHVFLATDQQVLDVMSAPDGVFAGTKPGTIVLLHSTILPATTQRAAELAPKGVVVIDAPCTSKPNVLEAGGGMFLVGGPKDVVEKVRAHLKPLSKDIYHFGPLGAGNAAKIAKNLGNVVERVMVAETARLVESAGLDIEQFLAMTKAAAHGGVWAHWERVLVVENGHASPKRAAGLVSKDIHHAMTLAKKYGLKLPVTNATAETAGSWHAAWKSGGTAKVD